MTEVGESEMVAMRGYLDGVCAVVEQARQHLPAGADLTNVHVLIDHGEPAEGLVELAWIISNLAVEVPRRIIEGILQHTDDPVTRPLMPLNLWDFATDESDVR